MTTQLVVSPKKVPTSVHPIIGNVKAARYSDNIERRVAAVAARLSRCSYSTETTPFMLVLKVARYRPSKR